MTHPDLASSFSPSALEQALTYAARFHKSYGLVVVVLDHMGEQQSRIAPLTTQLYPLLKRNVRLTDRLLRVSDDAWVIFVDECEETNLQRICHVLKSQLKRHTTQLNSPFEETIVSVRSIVPQTQNHHQLVEYIEKEIQSIKLSLRRLKLVRSTSLAPPNPQAAKKLELLPIIHEAILDNRLLIAFQPILEKSSQKIHYYECLARIIDQEGNILPAGLFISQCEKMNLIQVIDQKIQHLAIEELLSQPDLRLAINVSAVTASDGFWLSTLKTQMAAHPTLKDRLIIELTETAVFQNIDESIQFMTNLRKLGCQISIDDFGAGYMSLAHLKSDLVQTIKIDAQFIKNLTPDSSNIHFVRTLAALAHPLGIKCVAEGIEDDQTISILNEENVAYFQGYHIGKPLPLRPWVSA